jgi:hypothetical protein
MKFPKVSNTVIMAVVAIIIVLFFLRRGEKYDMEAIRRAFTEAGVSIQDENILGPLMEKAARREPTTMEESSTINTIMYKYPALGPKLQSIFASFAPSSTAPSSISSGIMQKMGMPAPTMQKMGMPVPTMQKIGMAPPRKFTCTFDQ